MDTYITTAGSWIYPVIISSVLFFVLISLHHLTSGPKYRKQIGSFGFISALADLISASIITANALLSTPINLNAIFLLHGIRYTFAFSVVLFVFKRIIQKRQGNGIFLVYLGFVWVMVTVIISGVITIMLRDEYWYYDDNVINLLNLILVMLNAVWGFIAIIAALFFLNRKHFTKKNENTMGVYITLVLVVAITTSFITLTELRSGIMEGCSFLLVDLPMKIALFISVYCGPLWITEYPDDKFTDDHEMSNDLENA